MSSPADSLVAPEPVFDRRFYPRTAPSSLTHVIFGPEISGELIDLGENGFRLAAPFELSSNFVCRATLPLGGLGRAIEVCVRVVWTGDANQAGIQFMDLSDEDRAQIRKWAALQEKKAAPAESTEILNDAGTQEESRLAPAPIQATPVVAELLKRRNRIGIAIAVGVRCILILTATGFAVWASPLGSWITKSITAGTKSGIAMAKSRNSETPSASTPLSQTNLTESTVAANAVTVKNDAMQRAEVKPPDLTAKEIVGPQGTTLKDAAQATAGMKYPAQKRSIAETKSIPAAATSSEGELDSSSKAPTQSDDKPDGDARTRSGDGNVESKPKTGLSATGTARLSGMSDAIPPASGVRSDFRLSRPSALATANSGGAPAEPEIIRTVEPTSRVVDVMLPNSPRPAVVNVPGERIFQSSALTLRIQRAILAPAGQAWWGAERKKKVVLGDLLARMDPRVPPSSGQAGSRVSVRVMLGKDGRVERLMPVNGAAELVPRVMRALREWRFQPTLLDGKPVETAAVVTIEFRGQGAAAATR